jgi:hypothetical protein
MSLIPESIEHRNGIDWFDAPTPPRSHECFVQTSAWIGFDQVQRCACGAIRNPGFGDMWMDRNQKLGGAQRRRLPELSSLMCAVVSVILVILVAASLILGSGVMWAWLAIIGSALGIVAIGVALGLAASGR